MRESNIVRQLGVCMDHSIAHLISNSDTSPHHQHIITDTDKDHIVSGIDKGERHLHMRRNLEQEAYYNQIAERISHFDHILLFGSTSAKSELYNVLKKDPLFQSRYIVVKTTDKMTENEKLAYVRDYFQKAIFPVSL